MQKTSAYLFRREMRDEFLKGRKLNNIAQELEASSTNLCHILKGRTRTSRLMVNCLMELCGHKNEEITKYFIRINKGE